MNQLFICVLVVLGLASVAVAKQCYKCEYSKTGNRGDPNCDDQFWTKERGAYLQTCEAKTCRKMETDDNDYVIRDCVTTCTEADITLDGKAAKSFCCDGNQCNGANSVQVALPFAALSFVAAVILKRIL